MSFNYVRLKLDINKVLTCGYTDFTGKFDTVLYEQVSGELPVGHEMLPIQTLSVKFESAMSSWTIAEKAEAYTLLSNITTVVANGVITVADSIIDGSSVLSIQQKTDLKMTYA